MSIKPFIQAAYLMGNMKLELNPSEFMSSIPELQNNNILQNSATLTTTLNLNKFSSSLGLRASLGPIDAFVEMAVMPTVLYSFGAGLSF